MSGLAVPALDPLAVYSIGLKLRTLRVAKHLTLARLAAQTGYSTALLSKLETDRMVPTLHTLEIICRVYGINLGHFFCEPQQHSVAITRKAHVLDTRERPHPKTIPLHVPAAENKLVSQIIELAPDATSVIGECGSVTEITAYVLEGTLHATVAGLKEVLRPGDCLVARTDQPIIWAADANSPCRVLSVNTR